MSHVLPPDDRGSGESTQVTQPTRVEDSEGACLVQWDLCRLEEVPAGLRLQPPVWSPGGRRIAFHSHRDGNREIYVMDADGSNQTNMAYKGMHGARRG